MSNSKVKAKFPEKQVRVYPPKTKLIKKALACREIKILSAPLHSIEENVDEMTLNIDENLKLLNLSDDLIHSNTIRKITKVVLNLTIKMRISTQKGANNENVPLQKPRPLFLNVNDLRNSDNKVDNRSPLTLKTPEMNPKVNNSQNFLE
jgi:hypothetical protein